MFGFTYQTLKHFHSKQLQNMVGAISTENVMLLFVNDGPLYGKIHLQTFHPRRGKLAFHTYKHRANCFNCRTSELIPAIIALV